MGKEKGREKDYLCSFQVIVLSSNIAAVTQECTLLWEYLFDQINSNLVIMQNVSHWIYLIMWESAAASSVFSLPHPQKPVKTPVERARVWKMCLRTWRTSGRTGSFSLFLLSHHALLSVLHLHYNLKLFDLWGTTTDARGRLLCSSLEAAFLWAVLDSRCKEAQSHGNSLGLLLIATTERVCICDLLQAISWHRLSHILIFFRGTSF